MIIPIHYFQNVDIEIRFDQLSTLLVNSIPTYCRVVRLEYHLPPAINNGKLVFGNILKGNHRNENRIYSTPVSYTHLDVYKRQGLARTFQRVRGLPSLSVRDNLVIGAFNHTNSVKAARAQADELLEALQLTEVADANAASLPIGTRKILEVGRVLSTKPKLVLLDEVMGGLGPTEVKVMVEFIRGLPGQGVSVLLVEHHMEAVMSVSDQLIAINRGTNLAEGTPDGIANEY